MRPIPKELQSVVFTVAEAAEYGITRSMLRGDRFVAVSTGFYRVRGEEFRLTDSVVAFLKRLPPDAAVSHTTNLALRGLFLGDPNVLHFVTCTDARVRRPGCRLHRYRWPTEVERVAGIPLLRPARTFVDCATLLPARELLAAGDWMIAKDLLTPKKLMAYVVTSHLDGVLKAREVAPFVRRGSESVQESVLRWELIDGGEPEPEINGNIHADDGAFLARGDLLYRAEKVVVEFDGWYHERSSAQRQHDLRRRERLEAAGWTVVIVTTADLRVPAEVVARVRDARKRSRFGRSALFSA